MTLESIESRLQKIEANQKFLAANLHTVFFEWKGWLSDRAGLSESMKEKVEELTSDICRELDNVKDGLIHSAEPKDSTDDKD